MEAEVVESDGRWTAVAAALRDDGADVGTTDSSCSRSAFSPSPSSCAALQSKAAPPPSLASRDIRVPHEARALGERIGEMLDLDMVIIFGASAITDRRDVVPVGLERAGGVVEHLGMPVDPGNLLLLGHVDAGGRTIPVIGAPGCARSPKENGFDFVLRRLLAGLPVTGADLKRMGVGGLLSEIVSRPQLRQPPDD